MFETKFKLSKHPENILGFQNKLRAFCELRAITINLIDSEIDEYELAIYTETGITNEAKVNEIATVISDWLENPEPELKPEDKATELQNIINALLGVE